MKNLILKYTVLSIFLVFSFNLPAQISVETDMLKIINPPTDIQNGRPLVLAESGDYAVLAPNVFDDIEDVNVISYYPNYEDYGANYSTGMYYKHDNRVLPWWSHQKSQWANNQRRYHLCFTSILPT